MKVRKGWILTYDDALRKMIPFFINVRSRDITPDNPITIDAALQHTSTRWTQYRVEDSVPVTVYKYTANWENTTDANGETVYSDWCDGNLTYYLYKDGRVELDGIIRLKASDISIGDIPEYTYTIALPYALPESNGVIETSWAYAPSPYFYISSTVEDMMIENAQINFNHTNTNTYPFKLKTVVSRPDTTTAAMKLFQSMLDNCDSEYSDYSNSDYSNALAYMADRFPIKIHYSGWWKDITTIVVDQPEAYDGEIAGTYKTNGMVSLLSKAGSDEGQVVRTLVVNTSLRNYGYYTKVDEVRWMLMVYEGTQETGFIPETLLTKV